MGFFSNSYTPQILSGPVQQSHPHGPTTNEQSERYGLSGALEIASIFSLTEFYFISIYLFTNLQKYTSSQYFAKLYHHSRHATNLQYPCPGIVVVPAAIEFIFFKNVMFLFEFECRYTLYENCRFH
jgi:hypothetical protein